MTDHDAFAAHAEAELHIDPHNLTDPWHATYASGLAFFCGAIIPILAIIIAPAKYDIAATFLSVVIALIITGALSANAGGAQKRRAIIRVVIGGVLAMLVTFGVGKLLGVAGL